MKTMRYTLLSLLCLLAACAEGKDTKTVDAETVNDTVAEVVEEKTAIEGKGVEAVEDIEQKVAQKKEAPKESVPEPMIMLDNFVAGTHYKVLSKPFPTEVANGEIEVREYFLYTCPHCFKAEKKIIPWKKGLAENVKFIPTPAIFRQSQELLARGYYVAKGLGVLDKTHMALFNRFHVEGKPVKTMDQMAAFFKSHGVDNKTFEAANKSPLIINQLKKASQSIIAYQVTGVPAFIVNGKYMTSGTMAQGGGYAKVLQIIDHLVEKEQQLLK